MVLRNTARISGQKLTDFGLIIRKNFLIELPNVGTNYFRESELLCHERDLNKCQEITGWGYCRAGASTGKRVPRLSHLDSVIHGSWEESENVLQGSNEEEIAVI